MRRAVLRRAATAERVTASHPAGRRRRVVAAAVLALALAGAAAAEPDACAAGPEAAAELLAIAAERAACSLAPDCEARIGERLAALAEAHPGDVPAQRAWQEHVLRLHGEERQAALAPLRQRFAARRDERPEDPAAHYLAGRLAADDEERRAAFERALAADPGFPWAHFGLAVLLGRGRDAAPADAAAVREHLAVFLAACPDQFQEVIWQAPRLGGEGFWRPRLPALRAAVEAAPPAAQVASLRGLWELDFTLTPLAEHDAVRERVRADLARLDGFDLAADSRWWSVRAAGWERVGDTARRDGVSAEAAERFPCGDQAEDLFQERVAEAVGGEVPGDARQLPGETRAAVERLARQALADCRDGFVYSITLFQMLAARDDLAPEERWRELRETVRVWEANRHRARMSETPFARVAAELLRHGLHPEEAVALARREIEETGELDLADPPETRLPADFARERRVGRGMQQAANRLLLAEALLATGDPQAAEESLAKAEGFLATVEPLATGGRLEVFTAAVGARLLALRARHAEATARPVDALAWHLAAAPAAEQAEDSAGDLAWRVARYARPAGGEDSRTAATRLWMELGGSPEAFAALASSAAAPARSIAAPNGWQPRDEPLADFALTDLAGRTWRLADLAGKTLFVNLWATWCGPCRQELPHVEALHRRLAGRDDVAVLTLNADDELGRVAPFLAEEGYTFPVLLAVDHVRETSGGALRLPQSWIVDGAGRLRHVQEGYSAAMSEDWMEEALALLEGTAAGDGATAVAEDGR